MKNDEHLLKMAGAYILQRYKIGDFKEDKMLKMIYSLIEKDYTNEKERIDIILDCMNLIDKFK